MSDTKDSGSYRSEEFVSVERLLPNGALLDDIRGTDLVVHIAWYEATQEKRDHKWIAHTPEEYGEFTEVRISTGVGGVNIGDFESALSWLERPRVYEYELVKRELVELERTPVPYRRQDTLLVECPECDRFGTVHPWKLDDFLDRWQPCPCGHGGDLDVR